MNPLSGSTLRERRKLLCPSRKPPYLFFTIKLTITISYSHTIGSLEGVPAFLGYLEGVAAIFRIFTRDL